MEASSSSASASASASASPSASALTDIPLKEKYDVFLSFRGPDTRDSFISHLFRALHDKKIETFIDDNLERGEEIAPALLKAIERSLISVVVFSENYASSRWCLDELVHIVECRDKYKRHVIPIFHKTVVSDIRHQNGSYELEKRFKDRTESERLKWKVALTEVANLSGVESKKFRNDSDLIQEVVQLILMKLDYESWSNIFMGLVGAESRVQKIESLLCTVPQDDHVRFLVIWGMGGIGKTTLADAVFHRLSSQFDACCFLGDVREGSGTQKELKDLRNKLLCELLGDTTLNIQSKTIGPSTAAKLKRRKVLVVLDDVDKLRQLEMLAGPDVTFGLGSRILITTRDVQRVDDIKGLKREDNHVVTLYEVEKLNDDEALQLFNLHASTGICSGEDISTNLLTNMLASAAGCPLALKHWSSLFHRRHKWDEITENLNEEMGGIYRVSYDVLRKNEKEIFLDMACFLKGEYNQYIDGVKRHLDRCGRHVDSGIEDLIGRSLIELRGNRLWMHDVIQEMGREIVKEGKEPRNRSRLYTFKDISHVLRNYTETATVETIYEPGFHHRRKEPMPLNPQVFRKMPNLTFLQIKWSFNLELPQGLEYLPEALRYLCWGSYPLGTLPSKFIPESLIELRMFNSKLRTLWNTGKQKPRLLKYIDLSQSTELVDVSNLTESKCLEIMKLEGCKSLVQLPNLSKCLNIASINLQGCKKLVTIPSYFEKLHKLTVLNLRECRLLKYIPEMPSNLEYLLLGNPFFQGLLDFGRLSYDDHAQFSRLPSSIWSLKKLVELDLGGCYRIKKLPRSIWMLDSLTSLDLSYTRLKSLPSSIECLSRVVSIKLHQCCKFVSLSDSICKLKSLVELDLSGCSSFKLFPKILEPMESLKTLRLCNTEIEELHESIENLVALEELNLSMCMEIKSIPTSIKGLSGSLSLYICNCEQLESLPELPSNLKVLDADGCINLEMVSFPMTAVTQGLDQICDNDSSTHEEVYSFRGCKKLSETAKCNILVDSQLRIMRMGAAFPKCKQINPGWSPDYSVATVYPGNEVPLWFDNRGEGSSIDIELPPHPSQTNTNLRNESGQLVLCAVITVNLDNLTEFEDLDILFKSTFTTKTGDCSLFDDTRLIINLLQDDFKENVDLDDKSLVFVWYCAHWSPYVRNASGCKASFNFYFPAFEALSENFNVGVKVEKCGVTLLSPQAQEQVISTN